MCSRIEIMGSIVPVPPLPHCHLLLVGYGEMAQDVPGAGGGTRLPSQESRLPDRRTRPRSRRVFRVHPVVYERGEGGFIVPSGKGSAVVDILELEVSADCDLFDLFDHQRGLDQGGHWGRLEWRESAMDPNSTFNVQTRHFSTLIRCKTQPLPLA